MVWHKKQYRKCLALAVSIAMMAVGSAAQVTDDEDAFPYMLLIFVAADDKCGLVETDARGTLETLLQFALDDQAVSEEKKALAEEFLNSGELANELDCNSDEADELTKMVGDLISGLDQNLMALMDQDPDFETPVMVLDLSRFRAAPGACLGHLPFEGDRAFPTQC